ncbi:FAD-dependent oxidoreductase [Paracrocinitomix mangrovi]|uniref:NAD(P)/FAD-dependent oxidoreductase n=1 Tax=Paracrocinitomix mangrovi TaxID=2862509 RepID=UPI001C8E7846|nr:FAD-dependent oxidoreductase [Paracrocinitomix mangrovi]UKN02606.1 FAD-dependent oxidoreductase [Paracrocinitomix mangrovi]
MEKIVIIGNGIAGVTAARHIRKNSDNEILIISAETEHFFSRTALMYVFMGHMRFQDIKPYEDWFWEKNRIDLKFDYVERVDTDTKSLQLKSGQSVNYDKLIIATGSKPNKFGWPGENLNGVQGLYSYQDLEMLEENSKTAKSAVIVGGGLIGIEMAEMMISRGIEVTLLVRESVFWGNVLPQKDGELINRHIKEHHAKLRLHTELKEIVDDGNGNVAAVITQNGEKIDCQIVGLTVGVTPNVNFLKESNIQIDRGVVVNEYFESNIQDVYAIGDCAQFTKSVNGRRNIEQVWYTGRIMGETLAQTICGNKMAYNPGPWFNSAKFFDIEYQTYGWVFAKLQEGEKDFYWEHPKGKIALHIVWDSSTSVFKGINVFGIRMRHQLFDQWLKGQAKVEEVMANLKTANFDPEFYSHYEKDIIQKFVEETHKNVDLKPKTWWRKLITNA